MIVETDRSRTDGAPDSFCFACQKERPCFTTCCANLKLVLTPYDILRLKTRLHLSSDAFLRRFTTAYADQASGLPVIRLKMTHATTGSCPFVTPHGCTVYADRPGACRLYPLGQAVSKIYAHRRTGEYYFQIKEAHCLGWQAQRKWTINEWLSDQGLDADNAMNAPYLQLATGRPPNVLKKLGNRQLQMYYMACYNLDEFRRFILESSFRQRFDLAQATWQRLMVDDVDLLTFAAHWLEFALFGVPLKTANGFTPR
jgi:uncharacterized protein